jgi:hypothetical protein
MWYKAMLTEPKMRGAAGWAFESYVHDIFRHGCNFSSQLLTGYANHTSPETLGFNVRLSENVGNPENCDLYFSWLQTSGDNHWYSQQTEHLRSRSGPISVACEGKY